MPRLRRGGYASLASVLAGLIVMYFWSDLCLWRAEMLITARRESDAQRWVQRSRWLAIRPNPRASLLQLRIARRLREFRDVERLLQQAAQLGVPARELQRERWLAMAQVGQFSAMQDHWSELLNDPREDGPDVARAYYTWAMVNHNVVLAEQTLKSWHADYPRDPEPLALSGRFYQSLQDWKGAADSYQQALALAPKNDDYRIALANALQSLLKTADARPLFKEYLQRHPDDLQAIRGLAQCAATEGDIPGAIRLLNGALERVPEDFATQKALGEILLSAGDAEGAAKVLEKAHRAVPEHSNLAYSLAQALKQCGRDAEAEPLLSFVAESRPHLDELVTLEARLRRQPRDLELRMKIAEVTARYVSRRDAIRWYENLLQIAPSYGPAHAAVAELYRSYGEDDLARLHSDGSLSGQSSNQSAMNSASPSTITSEAQ